MTRTVDVEVVSVFTNEDGAFGNELGIVESSDSSRGREQDIATQLGFSETIFIDVMDNGGTATVRIFTPTVELPFAGHPTVGVSWWLRRNGVAVKHLSVPAGDVGVRFDGDLTWVSAMVGWTPEFEWSQVDSPAALRALDPMAYPTGKHYVYTWLDEAAGRIVSRMFAPEFGIDEDQATGAAAVRLTGRLGRDLDITQGRGSRLYTRRLADARIEVGGTTRFDRSLSV